MTSVDEVEFSTAVARVDREWLWQELTAHTYWAKYRTRAMFDRQLDCAWRIVGAYRVGDGQMVGFCRAFSDEVAMHGLPRRRVRLCRATGPRYRSEADTRDDRRRAGARLPVDAAHRRRAPAVRRVRVHRTGFDVHGASATTAPRPVSLDGARTGIEAVERCLPLRVVTFAARGRHLRFGWVVSIREIGVSPVRVRLPMMTKAATGVVVRGVGMSASRNSRWECHRRKTVPRSGRCARW